MRLVIKAESDLYNLNAVYNVRINVILKKPEWKVPIWDYVKNKSYPGWMKYLGRRDMAFRKGVLKLPLSHLFYVLSEKQR